MPRAWSTACASRCGRRPTKCRCTRARVGRRRRATDRGRGAARAGGFAEDPRSRAQGQRHRRRLHAADGTAPVRSRLRRQRGARRDDRNQRQAAACAQRRRSSRRARFCRRSPRAAPTPHRSRRRSARRWERSRTMSPDGRWSPATPIAHGQDFGRALAGAQCRRLQAVIRRNVRLMRGPTLREVAGTACRWFACVAPAISSRLPCASAMSRFNDGSTRC